MRISDKNYKISGYNPPHPVLVYRIVVHCIVRPALKIKCYCTPVHCSSNVLLSSFYFYYVYIKPQKRPEPATISDVSVVIKDEASISSFAAKIKDLLWSPSLGQNRENGSVSLMEWSFSNMRGVGCGALFAGCGALIAGCEIWLAGCWGKFPGTKKIEYKEDIFIKCHIYDRIPWSIWHVNGLIIYLADCW